MTQLDTDSESGSSDSQSTHHTIFARELPAPKLTLEQTYGPMPLQVVINRDCKACNRDCDRFAFYNPLPFVYKGPADYWHPKHDHMNAVDDDRSPTTSPKPSMVSTIKGLSVMDIQDLRDQELEQDAPVLSSHEQARLEWLDGQKRIDRALDQDIGRTDPAWTRHHLDWQDSASTRPGRNRGRHGCCT